MSTSNEFLRHYDGYYTGEEQEWRRLGAIDKARNIIDAWSVRSSDAPQRVIELGCGDGAIARCLDESGFLSDYTGFDISESGIARARELSPSRLSFSVSGVPVPRADDSADVVIMSHVVEHLEHPRQLILEARRLAPVLIVEVPLELNRGLSDDYDWDPVGHINKYDRKTIRQLLQTCQYDVVRQFTTNTSKAIANFHRPGVKSSLKWGIKEAALSVAPRLARSQFTYHETLLAIRGEKKYVTASA